jgi:hypothetical protein
VVLIISNALIKIFPTDLFIQCLLISHHIWVQVQCIQFIRIFFISPSALLIVLLLGGQQWRLPIRIMVLWLSTPGPINVKTLLIYLVGPVEHGYPDWKEGVNKAYWGIK